MFSGFVRGQAYRPPHIIVDNPPLIEGRIQILVKDIWGDAHQDFYLAGDPIHRKIEFKEKCDKTHQDMPDAEHDYSYCLMRFGLLPLNQMGGKLRQQKTDFERRLNRCLKTCTI